MILDRTCENLYLYIISAQENTYLKCLFLCIYFLATLYSLFKYRERDRKEDYERNKDEKEITVAKTASERMVFFSSGKLSR